MVNTYKSGVSYHRVGHLRVYYFGERGGGIWEPHKTYPFYVYLVPVQPDELFIIVQDVRCRKMCYLFLFTKWLTYGRTVICVNNFM